MPPVGAWVYELSVQICSSKFSSSVGVLTSPAFRFSLTKLNNTTSISKREGIALKNSACKRFQLRNAVSALAV